MKLKTKIENDLNEQDWDQNLKKNSNSTVYQSYNWSKIYKTTYDSKPVFISILNENDEIVGQLLGFIHNRYYWMKANPIIRRFCEKLKIGSIFYWWYGPIIHDKLHSTEIISKIIESLNKVVKENNVILIRGSSTPQDGSIHDQLFKKNHFIIKPWGTYILNLDKKSEVLFEGLDKKIRYDIRKAEKNNINSVLGISIDDYHEYSRLKVEATQKKYEKNRLSILFNTAHLKFLGEKKYEQLFLAKHENQTIGGILNLIFNGRVIQHGVVNSSIKDIQGGSLLTWNAIKWASEQGFNTYDMGGVNPYPSTDKEHTINFYKSKWGGQKIVYSTFIKIINKPKYSISRFLIK